MEHNVLVNLLHLKRGFWFRRYMGHNVLVNLLHLKRSFWFRRYMGHVYIPVV